VFIHGVRFANTTVWLSTGKKRELWPRWLVEEIPGLGVWSVEHDSAPTQWRGHSMHLVDRASNLLELLLGESRLKQGDIAFVVHSFGGLILQQALRVAADRSDAEMQVEDFLSRVSRVDPTALLNAGMLGLLDRMFAIAKKVVVQHSTLAWLFEEKQRIRFHQPSKITDAHEIKRLLDANVLQRFEATAPVDEDLIREVGSDLASLFAEAEADWGDDSRPRLVVRSRPVHRVGSLMEEEADLSSHAGSLCGCLDVIEALARQGRVTRVEEARARAFLKLHETPWTHTAAIVPGSVLYLDGVSVAHFQHLGVLQSLRLPDSQRSFRPMKSPKAIVSFGTRP
jgi:hypothetical protein